MTSNPPPKITSVPAGTPSGEWANKTESMLQSDAITTDPAMKSTSKSEEPPITTTTNLNTPGHEFPGSYPRELEGQEEQVPQGNGSEGPPMASVVQTAKQYMPDNVERTVEYAGQRAAAYLPIPQGIKNTVTSYWCTFDPYLALEPSLDFYQPMTNARVLNPKTADLLFQVPRQRVLSLLSTLGVLVRYQGLYQNQASRCYLMSGQREHRSARTSLKHREIIKQKVPPFLQVLQLL